MVITLILFLLLINIGLVLLTNYTFKFSIVEIKILTIYLNVLVFVISLFLWLFFDSGNTYYQAVINLFVPFSNSTRAFAVIIGLDGYSLFLVLLTTFIFPLCFLVSWSENLNTKNNLLFFLCIEFFLIITFSSLDLFVFFITFEGTIIPMFLLIGGWGGNKRKIKASYYFFLYTFFGSLFLLFALLFLMVEYGTLNYYVLSHTTIIFSNQLVLWVCFFIPFAIKAPLFPFHIWLPEAHVEAPTSASILLASLMLKLGIYGILRFLVPLCPDANLYFLPATYTFLLVGLLYTSMTTIRQTDIKRIVAYSSVCHMTYVLLGIITYNYYALQGSVILLLAHGLTSSGLFFLIGVIYSRSHTRLLNYYSGVVVVMPLFTLILFFFCLANFAMPLTVNFIAEFLILLGLVQQNLFVAFFSTISIFCSLIYSMWFFNRLSFGNLKLNYIGSYTDLTRQEIYAVIPLLYLTFLFGLFPNAVIGAIDLTLKMHLL